MYVTCTFLKIEMYNFFKRKKNKQKKWDIVTYLYLITRVHCKIILGISLIDTVYLDVKGNMSS